MPGTVVLMADGSTKKIEEIQVGDWVWAHDPETGEEGPRQVTDLIIGEGEKQLVEITDQDGDVVTATGDHPFWEVTRGEWLDAGELQVGDVLLTQDGRILTVAALHSYTVYETVYNLTVDGLHTYYVLFGDDAVLVHNCTTRSARRRAVRQAWRQERDLVRQTGRGTRQWTQAELQELLQNGRVRGYQGHHINNVADHPLFAGLPENIEFVTPLEHIGRHGGNWANRTTGPILST